MSNSPFPFSMIVRHMWDTHRMLEGYLSNNNNDDMGILDIEWL